MEVEKFLKSDSGKIFRKLPEINSYLRRLKGPGSQSTNRIKSLNREKRGREALDDEKMSLKSQTSKITLIKGFEDGILKTSPNAHLKINSSHSPSKFKVKRVRKAPSYGFINEINETPEAEDEIISSVHRDNPLYKEIKRKKEAVYLKEKLLNDKKMKGIRVIPKVKTENMSQSPYMKNRNERYVVSSENGDFEEGKEEELQKSKAEMEELNEDLTGKQDLVRVNQEEKALSANSSYEKEDLSPQKDNENPPSVLDELKPKSNTEFSSQFDERIDEYMVSNSQYYRHVSGFCSCFNDELSAKCSFLKPSIGLPGVALRSQYQKEFLNFQSSKLNEGNKVDFKNLHYNENTLGVSDNNSFKNLKTTTQSDFRSPSSSDYNEKAKRSKEYSVTPSFFKKSNYRNNFLDYSKGSMPYPKLNKEKPVSINLPFNAQTTYSRSFSSPKFPEKTIYSQKNLHPLTSFMPFQGQSTMQRDFPGYEVEAERSERIHSRSSIPKGIVHSKNYQSMFQKDFVQKLVARTKGNQGPLSENELQEIKKRIGISPT